MISENDVKKLFSDNHFKNEKEMCDYIELNMPVFCEEVLGDTYIKHKREYTFNNGIRTRRGAVVKKGENNTRIDFLILCNKKNYAVECKNPIHVYTELSRSIGQLIVYDLVMNEKKMMCDLVLISSRYDKIVIDGLNKTTISPRIIFFNKNNCVEVLSNG